MKQVVTVTEVSGKGFDQFYGKRITLFCANYIYTGDMVGSDDDCVQLSNAAIVYETGEFDNKSWKDAQNLPNDVYVMKSFVESFMELK